MAAMAFSSSGVNAGRCRMNCTRCHDPEAPSAVPVFHAYGGQDRNVDIANGTAIKAAFERAGKAQEWMFVGDEAHGYRQDKNRFEFYTRFERFILANTPKALAT